MNKSKLYSLTENEYGDLPLPLPFWPINEKNPSYIVTMKLMQKLHWKLGTKFYMKHIVMEGHLCASAHMHAPE